MRAASLREPPSSSGGARRPSARTRRSRPAASRCSIGASARSRGRGQTILTPDDRYDRYRKSPDWIEQYIFPGALIASLGALASASKRASRLMGSEVHEIGPNYAETLRRWREDRDAQIDEIRALGYDKRFERTWHFYLAFCEAGFRASALATCRSRRGDRSNQPARSSASIPRWLR